MPRDDSGEAGGRAVQDPGATLVSQEVQALLVEWRLESSAAAFAELGLERVIDLEWVHAVQIAEMQISPIAKSKAQAMLKWFLDKQKAAEPPEKEEKREEGVGEASGGGAQKKRNYFSFSRERETSGGGAQKKVRRDEGPKAEQEAPREIGGRWSHLSLGGQERSLLGPKRDRGQVVASGGGIAQGAAGAAGGSQIRFTSLASGFHIRYKSWRGTIPIPMDPTDTVATLRLKIEEVRLRSPCRLLPVPTTTPAVVAPALSSVLLGANQLTRNHRPNRQGGFLDDSQKAAEGTPPHQKRLVFKLRPSLKTWSHFTESTEDQRTLADYNVAHNSHITYEQSE